MALAVVSLVLITLINYNIPLDLNICLFVFFGTITGYNFVKYAGVAGLHHRSLTKNLRLLQIFSLIIFFALIYIAFKLPQNVLFFTLIMGIFTSLYILPFFGKGRNLRGLAGVKIFVIAFVWSGVTVVLPLINKTEILQWNITLDLLQRFLFVFALILPFEIRDLRFDMAKLNTIPQIFGVPKTKIIGILTILATILLEFLKVETTLENLLSLIAAGILLSILITKSRIRQPKYYSSFWVEGVPIAWILIALSVQFMNW